ncbi:FAD binding domain protein [Stachybotrys elegans]|uniref:L-ornithine N(5)-monooxygenase [NAD(P)H] n=1 Tax=Stachybotrys elegans TaxID=80388 RepID=A0A8K0WVQ6_9HYPO|nr:FAD binding domain protein [Stachybotrys elegans]
MSEQEADIYDVIIVGAGPCGLSAAARLRERTPAALFTDEEQRRFSWINKHRHGVSIKNTKTGKVSPASTGYRHGDAELRMLVLDSSGPGWLARWNRLFATYDISHLRSPMLWHVDPQDRDALLAYAYEQRREGELVEITNCVGKEISKHAKKKNMCSRHCGGKQNARVAINLREKNDYFTPSRGLFSEHCRQVADRYGLEKGLVHHEAVEDIDYDVVKGVSVDDEKLFTVTTRQQRRFARIVIMAVGPANVPRIPHIPSMPASTKLPQACHSMEIQQFPDAVVVEKMASRKPTNILVVGGGLTSAQLSDLAIRRGVSKVYHIMRGPCRVKHFDVDLQWMGKYKNTEQARFWLADTDSERLEMIKEARGGGSFTPLFHRRVKKHVATGKLELHAQTCIEDARFDEDSRTWHIKTCPPIAELGPIDYIYFATGIQSDFASLPYLQTMLGKYPIHGHGGFPCVTEDLMWNKDVPLFVLGRLAALQLGPAAPNIGGARLGAERAAWAVEEILSRRQGMAQAAAGDAGSEGLAHYLAGNGNMYSALASACDDG